MKCLIHNVYNKNNISLNYSHDTRTRKNYKFTMFSIFLENTERVINENTSSVVLISIRIIILSSRFHMVIKLSNKIQTRK